MGHFYYFTDTGQVSDQTDGDDAFGPQLDDAEYRFTHSQSHTGSAPAVAVCTGTICIQRIGTTNIGTIILRPEKQPTFAFPFIQFFIYKNIDLTKFFGSAGLASGHDIPFVEDPLFRAKQGSNPEVGAQELLGLTLNGSHPDGGFSDTDPVDHLFYTKNEERSLPRIKAGEKIGEFLTGSKCGFEVRLQRLGHNITLGEVREAVSILTVNSPAGTDAEIFEHWHEKDACLNYVDPVAFFGAFGETRLRYFLNGDKKTASHRDDIVKDVLSSCINVDRVYLDLRNDYGFALNYFRDRGHTARLKSRKTSDDYLLDQTITGWPILSFTLDDLDNSGVFPGDIKRGFFRTSLELPQGDNMSTALAYLSRGFVRRWRKLNPEEKAPQGITNPGVTYTLPIRMSLPMAEKNGTDQFCPNYFKINLYDMDRDQDPATQNSLAPSKAHYLNGLFRPNEMKQSISAHDGIYKLTVWHEEVLVNLSNFGNLCYVANIGIANDTYDFQLFAIPKHYVLRSKKHLHQLALVTKTKPTDPGIWQELAKSAGIYSDLKIVDGSGNNYEAYLLDHYSADKILKSDILTLSLSISEFDAVIGNTPGFLMVKEEELYHHNIGLILNLVLEMYFPFDGTFSLIPDLKMVTRGNAFKSIEFFNKPAYPNNKTSKIKRLGAALPEECRILRKFDFEPKTYEDDARVLNYEVAGENILLPIGTRVLRLGQISENSETYEFIICFHAARVRFGLLKVKRQSDSLNLLVALHSRSFDYAGFEEDTVRVFIDDAEHTIGFLEEFPLNDEIGNEVRAARQKLNNFYQRLDLPNGLATLMTTLLTTKDLITNPSYSGCFPTFKHSKTIEIASSDWANHPLGNEFGVLPMINELAKFARGNDDDDVNSRYIVVPFLWALKEYIDANSPSVFSPSVKQYIATLFSEYSADLGEDGLTMFYDLNADFGLKLENIKSSLDPYFISHNWPSYLTSTIEWFRSIAFDTNNRYITLGSDLWGEKRDASNPSAWSPAKNDYNSTYISSFVLLDQSISVFNSDDLITGIIHELNNRNHFLHYDTHGKTRFADGFIDLVHFLDSGSGSPSEFFINEAKNTPSFAGPPAFSMGINHHSRILYLNHYLDLI